MKVKLVSYSKPFEELEGIESAQDLVAFCARVSNPSNQSNKRTATKLLDYLMKHKHWSPFEMVSACLEIETTRDIARQMLRHRSFSFQEFSQRYADPVKELEFVTRECRLQDSENRQNSVDIEHDPSIQTDPEKLKAKGVIKDIKFLSISILECENINKQKRKMKEIIFNEELTASSLFPLLLLPLKDDDITVILERLKVPKAVFSRVKFLHFLTQNSPRQTDLRLYRNTLSMEVKTHSILVETLGGNTDLINPVFGKVYADHMLRCDFTKGAWQDLKIIPYKDISISIVSKGDSGRQIQINFIISS